MKAMAKWLMAAAFLAMGLGTAQAEQDVLRLQAPTAKTAAWERVGDSGVPGLAAPAARLVAPGEAALQARKSEVVRRLFWIVLAHR